tara:strand:- start:10436 stop:10678 length:243 start_codon:yes stop_codon:yes gene_type:complete
MPKLSKTQKSSYRSSVINALNEFKGEKLNKIFEISIEKCEEVNWDNEEECGEIYDEILECSKEGIANKIFTKWFHLSENV